MRVLPLLGLALVLAGCATGLPTAATAPAAGHYASGAWPDGSLAGLDCEGPSWGAATCEMWQKPVRGTRSVVTKMRLQALGGTYLPALLAESAGTKLREPGSSKTPALAAADQPVLRAVAASAASACVGDKDHPDMVALCAPEAGGSIVLFLRGLCDRCRFEPVVLRKVN
ncbi:MAG: hypothetical protein ACXWC6_18480 [Ramlibacter sp.]